MWTSTHHREVFERDDLHAYIDVAVYSSEIPVAKPHSEAFRITLERLDVAPEEAVYVGDRLWEDVTGAAQIGMRTIWIPHSAIPSDHVREGTATPDATAHRLLDVFAIVESWQ
jgi:putative hydrolase of the HAD superfamily